TGRTGARLVFALALVFAFDWALPLLPVRIGSRFALGCGGALEGRAAGGRPFGCGVGVGVGVGRALRAGKRFALVCPALSPGTEAAGNSSKAHMTMHAVNNAQRTSC